MIPLQSSLKMQRQQVFNVSAVYESVSSAKADFVGMPGEIISIKNASGKYEPYTITRKAEIDEFNNVIQPKEFDLLITSGGEIPGPEGPQGAKGDPGSTPEIGTNGNWWIDGVDTGKPARGEKGEKGDPGSGGSGVWTTEEW